MSMNTSSETQEPSLQAESVMNMIRQLSPNIDAKWTERKQHDDKLAKEYSKSAEIQEELLKKSLISATTAMGTLCRTEEDANAMANSLVGRLEGISKIPDSGARREALLGDLASSYVKLEGARGDLSDVTLVEHPEGGFERVQGPVEKAQNQVAGVMAYCYDHSNSASTENMRNAVLMVAGELNPKPEKDLEQAAGVGRERYKMWGENVLENKDGFKYKNEALVSELHSLGYHPNGVTLSEQSYLEISRFGLQRAPTGSNSPTVPSGGREAGGK